MPVIACPHCGTKLNGPDSVLGKEVVCGQCRQRFAAVEVQPFGSQHAKPHQPAASADSGLDSMESLTPGSAKTPEPLSQPPQPAPGAPSEPPGLSSAMPIGAPSQPIGRNQTPPPPPPGMPQSPPPPPGIPQSPPPGAYAPPPPAGQEYYPPTGMLPPASGAGAAMVLGIVSIVGGVLSCCCLGPVGVICGILAIILSNKAILEIDSGQADPADRGRATAGRVCGIIGLILSLLGTFFWIINMATGHGLNYNYQYNF